MTTLLLQWTGSRLHTAHHHSCQKLHHCSLYCSILFSAPCQLGSILALEKGVSPGIYTLRGRDPSGLTATKFSVAVGLAKSACGVWFLPKLKSTFSFSFLCCHGKSPCQQPLSPDWDFATHLREGEPTSFVIQTHWEAVALSPRRAAHPQISLWWEHPLIRWFRGGHSTRLLIGLMEFPERAVNG